MQFSRNSRKSLLFEMLKQCDDDKFHIIFFSQTMIIFVFFEHFDFRLSNGIYIKKLQFINRKKRVSTDFSLVTHQKFFVDSKYFRLRLN